MYFSTLSTPIGELLLIGGPDHGLARVVFESEGFNAALAEQRGLLEAQDAQDGLAEELIQQDAEDNPPAVQLGEYFSGQRREFDLRIDERFNSGGTGYRLQVQQTLEQIPYGTTVTYTELAEMTGRPSAVRAAAGGCANNPVPIIRPCHRVLRSDGSLGGYRGGAEAKQWLIDFEGQS